MGASSTSRPLTKLNYRMAGKFDKNLIRRKPPDYILKLMTLSLCFRTCHAIYS